MRIFNGSSTVIDNIFIDLSRNFTINPITNGFSDHDAQLLKLDKVIALVQKFTSCYVRIINSFTIDEFQFQLSTESWEDIFGGSDTNVMINNFLKIQLKIFYACVTKSKLHSTLRYD